MYVGRDDRAAVVACFDDTASVVFGVLCQLCAGDAELAVDLLGETYIYLNRMADSSYGVDVDRRWMIDAAHSVYLARATESEQDDPDPVAALTPRDRVVVRLHDVERRGSSEIALLLGATIDDVERSLVAGRDIIAPPDSGTTPIDAFRHGDVWFDDTMRAEARARIVGPTVPTGPPDPNAVSSDAPADVLLSRRTMVGAGAAASIAALVGLGLWFGSSDGDGASRGSELPEAPSTTETTSPPTVPRTTTPVTDDTDATADTIVLGNAAGAVEPTTTPTFVPETGFIIDPVPNGLVPAAGSRSNGRDDGFQTWVQLWASADAARAAGRWLAIGAIGVGWSAPRPASAETRRLDVGGKSALVWIDPVGVMHVLSTAADGRRIKLQAYGFSIDQIAQLVASTTFSSDGEPTFAPAADDILDGLDLRISRAGSSAGPFSALDLRISRSASSAGPFGTLSEIDRRASYWSADGEQYVDVYAGPQREDDLFAASLMGAPSTDPVATLHAPNGTIDLGGRHVIVLAWGDNPLLLWHAGNYTVIVTGNIPLDALFDAVVDTRLATEGEWNAQVDGRPPQYSDETDSGSGDDEPEWVEVTKIDRSSESGVVVRLGIELDASGQRPLQISSSDGALQTDMAVDPDHPVVVYLDIDVTIIIAVFESPGPMNELRVSLPGRPPVFVPLVRLGDTDAYGAADAFSAVSDYAVALVDTDGTVIQEYDV